MFSSWKYQATDCGSVLTKRPQVFDPVTAKTAGPQACVQCRAKKAKCTGERRGCRRCRELGKPCTYARSAAASVRGQGVRRSSKQQARQLSRTEHWQPGHRDRQPEASTTRSPSQSSVLDAEANEVDNSASTCVSTPQPSLIATSPASWNEHDFDGWTWKWQWPEQHTRVQVSSSDLESHELHDPLALEEGSILFRSIEEVESEDIVIDHAGPGSCHGLAPPTPTSTLVDLSSASPFSSTSSCSLPAPESVPPPQEQEGLNWGHTTGPAAASG
ncbi:hypothetical protein B0T19DRAFT_478391 [Cercophora scortea]|uniref:Zn(2)-C6 fungal-type domain-containing protein n=1 Tax=Cercophora scortea TaxID=314031 RepID=A0AAE0IAS2_9PEZI|nr:hypothetical protein B0T19DRAFT_478391 [Cercophora scortea]